MKISKGFHLIELLTAVSILAILVTLCVPLYSQYSIRAKRLEAAAALTNLAVAMEVFHVSHHTYEGATLSKLNFPEKIAKNNYRLAIRKAVDNDYLLIAKPLGKQAGRDKECAALLLSANEKRDISGSGKVSECW